jgi:oligosaccharyltransferase complex subunit gamma
MLGKSSASEDGFISMSADQFDSYVLNNARTYSVLVYLTASDPQFNCQPCRELRSVIGQFSKAFEAERAQKQTKNSLFFVELDYGTRTAPVFQALRLNTVPKILMIESNLKNLKVESLFEQIGSDGEFMLNQGFHPSNLATWISKKSGVDAPNVQFGGGGGDHYDEEGGGGQHIGGGPVSGAGFIVALLIVGLPIFYIKRRDPVVYFVIATAAFFFCISGGMFNIIRQVPFAEVDRRTGKTVYFSGGGQFQYASEGYIMGFLQILGGIIMVILNTFAVKSKNKTLRNALVVALGFGLWYLFSKIRELYQIKMPGYNHGHVWSWRSLL